MDDRIPLFICEFLADMANKEPANAMFAEAREIVEALVRCEIYKDGVKGLMADITSADPKTLPQGNLDLLSRSIPIGQGSEGLRRLSVIQFAACETMRGMQTVMDVGPEDSCPNADNISVAHQMCVAKIKCIQGLILLCVRHEFPQFARSTNCYYVAPDGQVLLVNFGSGLEFEVGNS